LRVHGRSLEGAGRADKRIKLAIIRCGVMDAGRVHTLLRADTDVTVTEAVMSATGAAVDVPKCTGGTAIETAQDEIGAQ